jgi:hypothetical protein
MPINLNDSVNPAETRTNLNLIQTLNTFAFVIKSITGKSSWKIPPSISLETVGTRGSAGIAAFRGHVVKFYNAYQSKPLIHGCFNTKLYLTPPVETFPKMIVYGQA